MTSDPYAELKNLPKFRLMSADIADGAKLSAPQLNTDLGGQDLSPHLKWSGFPPTTKSFVVTVYDPDAPRPGGFWHWAVVNIPASVTELAQGVGRAGGLLPAGAKALKNGRDQTTFMGAAPPAGTGRHRYFFVVYALNIDKLDLPDSTIAADLPIVVQPYILAWASLVPWYEQA